jgi:hypothetical protein
MTESKIHSNYEMHQIVANERVDEMDEPNRQSPSKLSSQLVKQSNKPIDGSSIQKIVEKNPDIQDFDETVEIIDSVVIDHVSEDDKSISSEEVTYERWTEETKLFKTKVFQNGELVNEIVEQSNPELVGDILREKLIERHEHITHISQDVKKRLKTKSPGQSRRQSLDINEILNNDLNGSSVIIVEPTLPSTSTAAHRRHSATSDNTYYIQHQQVITPTAQLTQPIYATSSLISGTKKTAMYSACCSASASASFAKPNLMAYFKTAQNFSLLPSQTNPHLESSLSLSSLSATSGSPSSSSSSSSISSSFLLNHNKSTAQTTLSGLISKKNLNYRKRFSKYNNLMQRKSIESDSIKETVLLAGNRKNIDEPFALSSSSSSSSSTCSLSNLKCLPTLNNIRSNNFKTNKTNPSFTSFDENYHFDLKNNKCTANLNQQLNIEKSLLSSSFSSSLSSSASSSTLSCFNLLNPNLINNKDDTAHLDMTSGLCEQNKPNQSQPRPPVLSNISTYYGGLEAHNLIHQDKMDSDEVLVVRADYKEASKPQHHTCVPSMIDLRSTSPPFNSRTHVEKRHDLVKSQYEKITAADLLSSSSSSNSFDKVSVDYMITGEQEGRTSSNNNDEDGNNANESDNDNNQVELIGFNLSHLSNNSNNNNNNDNDSNNSRINENNKSSFSNKDNNNLSSGGEEDYVLVEDQLNELCTSYCDVNYIEVNEDTYENNNNNNNNEMNSNLNRSDELLSYADELDQAEVVEEVEQDLYVPENFTNEKLNKLKSKLESDETPTTTTTSDSLESMERFKRPSKLEMIKQQNKKINAADFQKYQLPVDEVTRSQQELDQPFSGILNAHDDDNSSHIDSCTSTMSITQNSAEMNSANRVVSKGLVKNYALMFQQQSPKDIATGIPSSSTSSSSSSSGSKKINEYLAKFESKADDKQKKLIDQLSKLNEECLLFTSNQTNVSALSECTSKTRDMFDLFYLDETITNKSPGLNKRFQTEYEKFIGLYTQIKSSNSLNGDHKSAEILETLKNLIEFKFSFLLKLISSSSSNQSNSLNVMDLPKHQTLNVSNKVAQNYFVGSSSIFSLGSTQQSDKLSQILNEPMPQIIQEEQNEEPSLQKHEDMTDISDEDELNIFESSNLVISNSPLQTASVFDKVKVFDNTDKPRTLPLRRESFEMAQKDSASKRLSISASLNNNSSNQDTNNTNSDSSVASLMAAAAHHSSSKPTSHQLELTHSQSQHPVNNKRMLSEIKPNEIVDRAREEFQLISGIDDAENEHQEKFKKENYFLNSKISLEESTRLENETSQLLLPESDESDSSDSYRHILQRNSDILNKKSNRIASNRNGYLTTEEQRLIDSLDDHLETINPSSQKKIEPAVAINKSNNNSFEEAPQTFVSSSHLAAPVIPSALPTKEKPSKIKVVPNNSSLSMKNRSVSPGMLRRGPDVIETIETTTSMSFIMNKRVNLVMEEKRLDAPQPQSSASFNHVRPDKPNNKNQLTSAISQPQLYQREIDDLLSSTGNLIMNNAKQTRQRQHQPDSTPIPISFQSRSKSEPRLNINHLDKQKPRANLIVSHDFENLESKNTSSIYLTNPHQYLKRRPLVSNGKYYEIPSQCPHDNSRITFHKYDSNEIIALVNMPAASYETTTVDRITSETSNITRNSYFHEPQIHNSKSFSRSEPNLANLSSKSKMDSWSTWPDYAVDQETDMSQVDSNDQLNKQSHSGKLVKANKFTSTNTAVPGDCYEFEIEIEKRRPAAQNTSSSICFGKNTNNLKDNSRVHIQNISMSSPGEAINIQSDINIFSKRHHHNNLNRLNSNSAVTTNGEEAMPTPATRISSGYFSGDEFRTYYNQAGINSIINAPIQNDSSSNSNFFTSNNNSYSSPNSATTNEFNVSKFLNSKKNSNHTTQTSTKRETTEKSFNTMYKSLGLEEDEIIFERTNVTDHPLYNKIDVDIQKNESESRVNSNFCQSSPNLPSRILHHHHHIHRPIQYQSRNDNYTNSHHQRSRSTNYDKLDRDGLIHSNQPVCGDLDHSETYSNFSIFQNEPVSARMAQQPLMSGRTSRPYDITTDSFLKNDMAVRRCKPMTPAQLDKEIYINYAYLNNNKSPVNSLEHSFSSSNYNQYHHHHQHRHTHPEPDITRDDASVLNTRKRSNSLSSLHSCCVTNNNSTHSDQTTPVHNPLILPSPTSADYLRNRIRETNLFNVVMNPTKSTTDVELSQILYDDMAYRQLRKDSDAYKLAQIKSAVNHNSITQQPSTPVINIATLPVNSVHRTSQQTDAYYQQQYFNTNNSAFNSQHHYINMPIHQHDDYENSAFAVNMPISRRNSNNNSINDSFSQSCNIKTVKMIKQKDASNKNQKHKESYSVVNVNNKLTNPQFDANRLILLIWINFFI